MDNQLSFIPLGGIGDVTKNMYLYQYKDQVLIVDCGLGFADETMLGVDLLLPDISYLLKEIQTKRKRIVGMVLTHGHEDHIGALPFILPQLPKDFPIFASRLTASFANEKLKEFGLSPRVQTVPFEIPTRKIFDFTITFIRVTHSVPDTAHLFLQTPIGNFYHGSDFKFDDTPADGKKSDYQKIGQLAGHNILCLMSDCLGSERPGRVPSEIGLKDRFVREMQKAKGKVLVTTYSSNVARLNQIIEASQIVGRAVCFVGRSLIKTRDAALKLGYLTLKPHMEVSLENITRYNNKALTLIVAGSQGQESSALSRIVNGEHKEVTLSEEDTVIFSADPIPGNELTVYELIDTIAKRGTNVIYSSLTHDFHVSGHGSREELTQLISLTKPKRLLPIGGNHRHMLAYKNMAEDLGYNKGNILLLEDGQEIIFTKEKTSLGQIIPVKNIYVDEIGEEVQGFVLRDRQKLSESGIVVIIVQIDAATGQMDAPLEIISRGFASFDPKRFSKKLSKDLQFAFTRRSGRVTNWTYLRRKIGEIAERTMYRQVRLRPLILPVVIEI